MKPKKDIKPVTIDEDNEEPAEQPNTPTKTFMIFMNAEKNLMIIKPLTDTGELILNESNWQLMKKEGDACFQKK